MHLLKQSTAVTVKTSPLVDATDGFTAETALTLQKADVRLSKNGGDMAAANADQGASDAGAAHDEIGVYNLSLDATDTGTLGRLDLHIAKAGSRPIHMQFQVVPANAYDSLIGGTDTLQADTTQVLGTALSESNTGRMAANQNFFWDTASLTTKTVDSVGGAAQTINVTETTVVSS